MDRNSERGSQSAASLKIWLIIPIPRFASHALLGKKRLQ
jgi:hypothetical protein